MEKQVIQSLVAANLRRSMNAKGVNNLELSRRCGISAGMVGKVLNGKTGITVAMAMTLSNGLGVSLDSILHGLLSLDSQESPDSTKKETGYKVAILSINNTISLTLQSDDGKKLGHSSLKGSLDLADTSSSLISLIERSLSEALKATDLNSSIFSKCSINMVCQSYELEDKRAAFENFALKHCKKLKVISDWQLSYISAFSYQKEESVSLIVDKGVSLSFFKDDEIKKISGWKFPICDLGGESWLGLQTIIHTIEVCEGYTPATDLSDRLLSAYDGKIERVIEECFRRGADYDVYSKFSVVLLRSYASNSPAATKIIHQGFEHIEKMLHRVDEIIGRSLSISLKGSLSDIYTPFLKERLLAPEPEGLNLSILLDFDDSSLKKFGLQ